jgi:hypothetical protein
MTRIQGRRQNVGHYKLPPVPPRPRPIPPPRALTLFNTWRSAHIARDFWKAAEALQALEEIVGRHSSKLDNT